MTTPVIAVSSAGQMGNAIGHRMTRRGARVLISLAARSPESAQRAAKAGMVNASDAEIAAADFFLSITPPHEAVSIAQRFATAIARNERKIVYFECNALSLETTKEVGRIVSAAGARFVDGCIIGAAGMPEHDDAGPALYLSGELPSDVATLLTLGLRARSTKGPIGAASALKMAYSGLNKGLTGLAAAMVVAATRAGAAQALHDEMAKGQPHLLKHIAHSMPDMYSKAYRWDFEMREVARFASTDPEVEKLFECMAGFYAGFAQDWRGDKKAAAQIDEFLATRSSLDERRS